MTVKVNDELSYFLNRTCNLIDGPRKKYGDFKKCEFHIHTPASKCYRFKKYEDDNGELEGKYKYSDLTLEEVINYSRVPVFEDSIDNIVGILYMKDFVLEVRKNGFENVIIKNILQLPYFVHENKNIDVLLKELQSSKNRMAILIDEYGGFSGIVTIQDLIEEVMGNIEDEYDDDEPYIKKVDDNTYIVSGLLSLDELNDLMDLDLVSKDYNTIGGFLISLLGNIPNKNEEKTIEYGNAIFKIEEVKENRIKKIKISSTLLL